MAARDRRAIGFGSEFLARDGNRGRKRGPELNYRRDFRAKDALAGSLVFRGNPKRAGKCIACYVARFVLRARAVQLFL